MADQSQAAVDLHEKHQGKIRIEPVVPVDNRDDLSLVYTPGVAQVAREIAQDKKRSFDLTWRGRTVAVISDGSAVLGLGNIGPEAALPVMEGKAMLLKRFGDVDALPIVVNTQDSSEIIHFIKYIAPSFAGILLEDISAPRCFQIEEELQNIGIPVFHDDQHGTAIVVSAALRNAAKVVNKPYESLKVVIVGAGAAGLAVTRILLGLNCSANVCYRITGYAAVSDVIVVDSHGALFLGRKDQNIYKQAVAGISNNRQREATLFEAAKDADAIIGVSGPGVITKEVVKNMSKDAIVFAMANPIPEIMPDEAKEAGAAIVATGRSDFPNQINNLLAFPGIFKAVIQGRLTTITQQAKQVASDALAKSVQNPTRESIVPDPFYPHLAETIAMAILKEST